MRGLLRALKAGKWLSPFDLWTSRRWEPGPIYMGRWQLDGNTIRHLRTGLTWGQFVKEFQSYNHYHPGSPYAARDAKYDVPIWGGRW